MIIITATIMTIRTIMGMTTGTRMRLIRKPTIRWGQEA